MAKHNQPLWYFIDFENTNSLGNIVPKANDKILLFLGMAQKALPVPLVQQLMDMPCEVELISVQGQSANNVDFHLSYYLGLYQASAPKTAKFVVCFWYDVTKTIGVFKINEIPKWLIVFCHCKYVL